MRQQKPWPSTLPEALSVGKTKITKHNGMLSLCHFIESPAIVAILLDDLVISADLPRVAFLLLDELLSQNKGPCVSLIPNSMAHPDFS